MKNFFNLLEKFRRDGSLVPGVYSDEWQLPPKIVPKSTSDKSPIMQDFFAGKNVCFEDISTYKGFMYQATVSSDYDCSSEQFETELENVLNELGLKARATVAKDNNIKGTGKYLVTIWVCN